MARKQIKLFTIAEANAMLPLLRSILRDITDLAKRLREQHEVLVQLQSGGALDAVDQEEVDRLVEMMERGQEQMQEYEVEIRKLGVEIKDYFTGLCDFPSMMEGRVVYLCWRMGEKEVAHWHELDAGFAGRQKLSPETANA
ncbi:MAG: DUF2203 domain-containing protein [Gemmataceae bacterium]